MRRPEIRIISEGVVNRIAAGEVVSGPDAIVKELVENAIDASSPDVTVRIRQGGKALVSVEDHGCGMDVRDIPLALTRHATSKMGHDLYHLEYFGFRGEALPSIASVSRLTLTSSVESGKGCSMFFRGGVCRQDPEEVSRPRGTTVEVRDLFFNVPARAKFLRQTRREAERVTQVMRAFFLAHPSLAFRFFHEDRKLYDLSPQSSEERATRILGEGLWPVSESFHDGVLRGFISPPTRHRGTSDRQYFFVNGRYVRDKLMGAALRESYGDFMPRGRFGLCALFLELDPVLVDVNIHPRKQEVRFRHVLDVRNLLFGALRRVVVARSNRTSPHLGEKFVARAFSAKREELRRPRTSFLQTTYRAPSSLAEDVVSPREDRNISTRVARPEGAVVLDRFDPETVRLIGQLARSYILAEVPSGLLCVDQHAAHERILYERLKKRARLPRKAMSQRLLRSVRRPFGTWSSDLLNELARRLLPIGVILSVVEGHVILEGVPPPLAEDPELLMDDILSGGGKEGEISPSAEVVIEQHLDHILAGVACKMACKAGDSLSIEKMQALLDQMAKVRGSAQCNHGRPTYFIVGMGALAHLFERT